MSLCNKIFYDIPYLSTLNTVGHHDSMIAWVSPGDPGLFFFKSPWQHDSAVFVLAL